MSGKMRYWSFLGVLALGVAAAVTVLAAQGSTASREAQGPGDRRELMFLDGRGSRLGVMVQDLDATDKTGGVRVDSVDPGSPAEKAGLETGDVVVEYDGERVRSARQFTRLVQETPEGRQVPMAVASRREAAGADGHARGPWVRVGDEDRRRSDPARFRARPRRPARLPHGRTADALPLRSRLRRHVRAIEPSAARCLGRLAERSARAVFRRQRRRRARHLGGEGLGRGQGGPEGRRRDHVDQRRAGARRRAGRGYDARRAARASSTIGYLRDKKAGTTKATIDPRPAPGAPPAEPRRPVRPAAHMRPVVRGSISSRGRAAAARHWRRGPGTTPPIARR